ncbi:PTS ascorbate transporter subunit IIC [Parafannyhessea umbonata]|jgi:PTS system ascorbate-specific IIC component|uniref:Ascorbate-specific PTS system EIIC component n=2 Tax=Parafannyhessea umbonata TaxID=604330 RepID=A0A1H1N3R4_9ACTN|nr:PTS ascorbate transporter subunit IIC [Parafannyhessea umbonata]MST60713.1 PTS transporter subunit IIC [Parafannyhessea umbonata]SDR93693.1 PTS system IIC component, L-Asc family [Parafannyhessea umbonata]
MAVLNWIVSNILTQASIIIALIAFLGLALQKKPANEVFAGTMKTLFGFMILSAGSSVLQGSLQYFGNVFNSAFHIGAGGGAVVASIEGINGQAMTDLGLGSEISIVLLGIFIVNLIIARFTKFKYIFLTGQALLWESTLAVVFTYFLGLTGVPLILLASLVGGCFATFMPAIAQPVVRKITGSDDIALGHFCTIGYMVTAGVAKLVGNPEESAEDVKIPEKLDFLNDTYLAVFTVMLPFYIIAAIIAGPAACLKVAKGLGISTSVNYIVEAFLQCCTFVIGLYILMMGVRQLLDNIVPAFQGISMKLVPGAKPALDCPVLFPYAPNSVILGFIFTTIGSIIGMLISPVTGYFVIPGVMSNFFAGGTAGIFGNAVGGRRGLIIGCIVHGIFIMIIPALLTPMLAQIGFVNLTCTDVDTVFTGFVLYGIKCLVGLFA